MEGVGNAHQASGGEMESASDLIGRAVRELSMVSSYDKEVEALVNQLAEIDSLLSDFNHEISSYISNAEFDDETFYETEKRLNVINHLKDKYGSTIEEILDTYEKKCKRMSILKRYDEYLNHLLISLMSKEDELESLCQEVSLIRKDAAKTFAASIKEALIDLNFLDVQFEVVFTKTADYTSVGIDEVEFLISTNPGEPVKPLDKTASGGELSRIMLAIKTVMAKTDDIEALIFDEIDSGISGRTAQMVSEKMNTLGRSHQVICITHLPQIAAMADTHFLIEKSVENKETHSKISILNDEESVKELA